MINRFGASRGFFTRDGCCPQFHAAKDEQGEGELMIKAMLIGALAGVGFLVAQYVYLTAVMGWCGKRTDGTNYCGLNDRQRRRFRRWLKFHSTMLTPILWLLSRSSPFQFESGNFVYEDVPGPASACRAESFQSGAAYQPRAEDVFVATQMRCGTTWMQHLVFQVATRGSRDLADEGSTLNHVSPWLESCKTVAVDEAPTVGEERPARIIKTHLPVSLCPYSPAARYIYVIRHPVSCFASCVDFVRNNLKQFAPDMNAFEEWFTSDHLMWWNTWVTHATGWWELSQQHQNVLFVRFEDMKDDLRAVAVQVNRFLGGQALSETELDEIVARCSFSYMQEHAETFEMHPPHLLQVPNRFFVSGKVNRFEDIPAESRERVLQWCRQEIARTCPPLAEFYIDLQPTPAAATLRAPSTAAQHS